MLFMALICQIYQKPFLDDFIGSDVYGDRALPQSIRFVYLKAIGLNSAFLIKLNKKFNKIINLHLLKSRLFGFWIYDLS